MVQLSVVQRCVCAVVLLLCVPSAAADCLALDDQEAGDIETCFLQAGVHLLEAAEQNGRTSLKLTAGEERKVAMTGLQITIFVLAVYAIVALIYELKFSDATESKQRVLEWDAVRLFVQMTIVSAHLHYCLILNYQWGELTPFWPRDAMDVAHRDYKTEDFLYIIPSIYKMPCFAFISGVFGQKVDTNTMLRVVCYTYGTSVIYGCLARLAWGQSGFPWYLVDLFMWRYTLSPLFSTVQNSSMNVKLALFAVISFLFYIMYDLTTAKLHELNNKWLPTNEYFSLGPFFAVGHLLPHQVWSALLKNENLQIVGVTVLALLYGSMMYAPHYDWVSQHAGYSDPYRPGTVDWQRNHWPVAPIPGQAFSPSHMLQHGLWLVYKTTFTLSIIWTVAAVTRALTWVAPRVASKVLAGGSRSMYSYLLCPFIQAFFDFSGGRDAIKGLSTLNWFVLNVSVSAFNVLVCTSKLTERIFHRIIMPFWLLDIPIWLGLVKRESSKPLSDMSPSDVSKGKNSETLVGS